MKKNSLVLLACSLMLLPSFCYAQSSGQNQREEAPAQVLAVGDSVEVLGLLGDYKGKLDVGAVSLNLVLHIYGDKNVTLDSPDQGAYGIPTTVCHLSTDSIHVKMDALQAEYAGKLKDGKIVGKFTQAGHAFDLNLTPGIVEQKRPQTPQPPYPYKTEEVAFMNGDATLRGTLTYPENYKKGSPVVLLVSGSGQQNRDEEIFGHKPFLVLADYLARHGIASLRYDDRTAGESNGDVTDLTMQVNMQDAQSGIAYLRGTKAFGKVGVIGHSEGGTIAYMLAARKKIDFLVSMAGPAMPGDSILMMQNRDLLLASGMDKNLVENYCRALKKIFDEKRSLLAKKNKAGARKEDAASQDKAFSDLMKDVQLPEAMLSNLKEVFKMDDSWFNSFLTSDPTADVRKTSCPVMALGGSKDLQVKASANLDYTRRFLPRSSKNVFKEYDGLNHLFQPCKQGTVVEYAQIETTISEEVLKDITDWIKKL